MNVHTPRPGSPVHDPAHLDTPPVQAPQTAASETAARIADALKSSAQAPDATILVVGYSPTGGGHTARTLNIVDKAISSDQPALKSGSTVVFHVPSIWNSTPRPGQLKQLSTTLANAGVNVIVAEADKSVHGYLDKDTGASDDVKILDHFAHYPARPPAQKKEITECKFFSGGSTVDFNDLPSISANDLMASMQTIVKDDAMKSRVKVLTDMDPALQKAAARVGVPAENRVDQQNHGILLDQNNDGINLHQRNSLLAKVLSGKGEEISHIELGDKNTLASMTTLAHHLGLSSQTPRQRAFEIVLGKLLADGKPVDAAATFNFREDHGEPPEKRQKTGAAASPGTSSDPGGKAGAAGAEAAVRQIKAKQAEGIMHHPSIQSEKDVRNVVYIYAHANQNRIAKHVHEQLGKEKTDPHFQSTLFVFCGRDAVKDANALHLAYLADADGITTAGAGTNGEFAYLNKHAGAQANLLVLPIKGHNEQEANAKFLATDEHMQTYVTNRTDTSELERGVNTFVHECGVALEDEKRRGGDMGTFLKAIHADDSYVNQSHDLLFGNPKPENKIGKRLSTIEMQMRESPLLKANRKFLKMTFQALRAVEGSIDRDEGRIAGPINIVLTQKPGLRHEYPSLQEFVGVLKSDARLKEALGATTALNEGNVLLLTETRALFKDLQAADDPSEMKERIGALKESFARDVNKPDQPAPRDRLSEHEDDMSRRIRELKLKFGEETTTGF